MKIKKILVAVLFVLTFFNTTTIAAQNYSYGSIDWSDDPNTVIKKMSVEEDYKFYALKTADQSIIYQLIPASEATKSELQAINQYISAKKGSKQLSALGFSANEMHGQLNSMFTASIFLFSKNSRLIIQHFKQVENIELIIENFTQKYGKPKTVESGFSDKLVWETNEKIIELEDIMGMGTITYINKLALSQTFKDFEEKYGKTVAETRKKEKAKANKF